MTSDSRAGSLKTLALLLLIIALGAFLRIYDLGTESIWLDEAHSVLISGDSLSSVIQETNLNETGGDHLPLYFIFLHFWISLFGSSEAAIRSFSAILGIISIPLVFSIGKTLFDNKAGLIAGFLSAVSLFHIEYSQEARPYALLLLLSLLSFLFFTRTLKQDRKWWYYLCYLITNVMLIYTHVYGMFIITAQILCLLLLLPRGYPRRFKLLGAVILSVLAILPIVPGILDRAVSMVTQGFWLPEPSFMDVCETLGIFAGSSLPVLIVFFFLAIIALFHIRKSEGRWNTGNPLESLNGMSWAVRLDSLPEFLLLAIWLFLPIALAFMVSRLITPIYLDRYFIGVSPALYLLVAKGLSNLKMRRIIYPVLLAVILMALPNLVSYYADDQKGQWRDAVDYVEMNAQPDDVIVFCENYTRISFDYYYDGNLDEFGFSNTVKDTEDIAAFVNETTHGKDRLWLLLSHTGDNPPIEQYLRYSYTGGTVVLEESFIGVEVILIDLKN